MTTKPTAARKTTARKTAARPAGVAQPQDRKPKATEAPDAATRVVELDGVQVAIELTALRNVRLMRRLKGGDFEALIEYLEALFGADQLTQLEDHFDLEDVDDYNEFIERVMGEVSPNS